MGNWLAGYGPAITVGLRSILTWRPPRRRWAWRRGLLAGVTTVADTPLHLAKGCHAAGSWWKPPWKLSAGWGPDWVFGYGSAGDSPQGRGLGTGVGDGPLPGAQSRRDASDGVRTCRSSFRQLRDLCSIRPGRRPVGPPPPNSGQRGDRRGTRRCPLRRKSPLGAARGMGLAGARCHHRSSVRDKRIRNGARLAGSGASATHAPGFDVPMGLGNLRGGRFDRRGDHSGPGHQRRRLQRCRKPLGRRPARSAGGRTGRAVADRRPRCWEWPPPVRRIGLGRSELGHLEPGAAADLCCYDITGVDDAGVGDPLAGLLWANHGRRPKHVVVAGLGGCAGQRTSKPPTPPGWPPDCGS